MTNPIFHDEQKAREFLENQRWPDGPVCTSCGQLGTVSATPMKSKKGEAVEGYFHCKDCRKRFTVRTGTLYERSHIPLHVWLHATYLLTSSKKGMSAHQLHRMFGITYKSAWFMAHRIREGMKETNPAPMGGGGSTVEADETFLGKRKSSKRQTIFVSGKGWVRRGGGAHEQMKIVTLVERGGRARSVHVAALTTNSIGSILRQNVIRKETNLMTDKANYYKSVGKEFASHQSVDHGKFEWSRGEAHTNTIEGVFSIFKRGMRGIYQHCSEAHLHRYLAEFDFRYSNRHLTDAERALEAVRGIEGKRLHYKGVGEARYA